MKLLLFSLLAILNFAFMPVHKTRIIFFGDSITESAVRPGGYITIIDSLAKKEKPNTTLELIGAGVSGHKVYDLYFRIQDDVIGKHPDVVVIYIGINDVWHKSLLGTGTDADRFEAFYKAMIQQLQSKNIKVILCTPGVIGEKTDHTNPQDGDLNAYAQIIRRLASQNGLLLVDLRKDFLQYNLVHNTANVASGILTTDRVHLNKKGNQLVAESIWRVLKSRQL